eukprot:gene16407-7813_t
MLLLLQMQNSKPMCSKISQPRPNNAEFKYIIWMYFENNVAPALFLFPSFASKVPILDYVHGEGQDHVTCNRTYNKIGCFEEKSIVTTLLVNDRESGSDKSQGHTIDWTNIDKYLHSLACRCKVEAEKHGFKYFGIRYFGECYGGNAGTIDNARSSSRCFQGAHYGPCNDEVEAECGGQALADYVYSLKKSGEEDIDGGYSEWTQWSRCSQECGGGKMFRSRACDNPEPKGQGKDCFQLGNDTESANCGTAPCPVNGGFSEWSDFGSCSVTCGTGIHRRERSCNNPPPSNGGLDCTGPYIETKECDAGGCPINGGYGEWKAVGECSKLCGEGEQTFQRECDNPMPQNGGANCFSIGPAEEKRLTADSLNGLGLATAVFYVALASSTEADSAITPPLRTVAKTVKESLLKQPSAIPSIAKVTVRCTHYPGTFGAGETKTLYCSTPLTGQYVYVWLKGEDHLTLCEVEVFSPDPINGGLSEWSSWGKCNAQCGAGQQYRTRSCNNPSPSHGGFPCRGVRKQPRPLDGGYGPWTRYKQCSVTCGLGFQVRTRECNNPKPAHGGKSCKRLGTTFEMKYCRRPRCPMPVSPPFYHRVCEHGTLNIACPVGSNIRIMRALYGRTTRAYCKRGWWTSFYHRNCRARRSNRIVKSRCNRKRACSVPAKNWLFGDPCFGTFKYLEVVYRCFGTSAPHFNVRLCEHMNKVISCPFGRRLKIDYAMYGRLSRRHCSTYAPNLITNCSATSSLVKTKAMCDGRTWCVLSARNGVYGDPCVGVYKYLNDNQQDQSVVGKSDLHQEKGHFKQR